MATLDDLILISKSETSGQNRPNVAAIDLDGTILQYQEGMGARDEFGQPKEGIVEEFKSLKDKGWKIVIWTCRKDSPELREHLRKHNIPFDEVNKNPWAPHDAQNEKIFADVYVDDKGLTARGEVKGLAKRITSLKEPEYKDGPSPANLPEPWGVLYVLPNPDGTRKSCGSCPLWVTKAKRCVIHDPSIKITQDYICGYYFYGRPVEHSEVQHHPISPSLTGLERVPGGTSCDNCKHFTPTRPDKGHCHAVANADGVVPKTVQALACCARWERL